MFWNKMALFSPFFVALLLENAALLLGGGEALCHKGIVLVPSLFTKSDTDFQNSFQRAVLASIG